MASKEATSASWADVVNQLLNSFLLLRDIFGYALPGVVFLGIGVLSGRLSLQRLHTVLVPYEPPWWVLVGLLVAVGYAVGHILVALAYLRIDAWKFVLDLIDSDQLKDHPTEVSAQDLYLRHFYTGLFSEKDRRETMAMLTFSLVAALLLGAVVFCWLHPTLCELMVWSGIILFVETLTTMSHLKRVRKAGVDAGALIEAREKATPDQLKTVFDAILQALGSKAG